jgi:glutamate/tyrosine decarboxylase-like PLP-dependent enzyme
MANFAGLAVGVRHVLAPRGGNVEVEGLFGAPEVTVVVGEKRHATVDRAVCFLGFGQRNITAVPTDDQGRMRPRRCATLSVIDQPSCVRRPATSTPGR